MHSQNPLSLKEKHAHGSQTFRCACYHAESFTRSFFTSLHWHEELEIIHFKEGHFTLEINTERYEIHSECFFFVHSGELHQIHGSECCVESAVVFSPYILSFLSNDDAQSRLLLPLAHGNLLFPRMVSPSAACYASISSEYEKLIDRLDASVTLPDPSVPQIFAKASLLNILGYLAEYNLLCQTKNPKNENVENIKTVLSFIHAHYTEKICIHDLAAILNLNEQYFCRFFKKMTGTSPITYINEYRIRRALELLTDTSMQVTEICLECGFFNLGNFLREFRRQTGTTPLQYRLKKSKYHSF